MLVLYTIKFSSTGLHSRKTQRGGVALRGRDSPQHLPGPRKRAAPHVHVSRVQPPWRPPCVCRTRAPGHRQCRARRAMLRIRARASLRARGSMPGAARQPSGSALRSAHSSDVSSDQEACCSRRRMRSSELAPRGAGSKALHATEMRSCSPTAAAAGTLSGRNSWRGITACAK